MFRNQYDTDCITWSPQGRIFQIEYAMEAVKQGTPVLGLRSNTHVVLCSFKRAQSELAAHQKKIFKIDNHLGIGISGLTADARGLSTYMRNECLNHKYIYETPMKVGRLVAQIGDKSQQKTQRSSKRPYGVGLLIGGYDENGPHLFETCPSGNYFEYKAMAIGGRSQTAKTYLEKHFNSFAECDMQSLIQHALEAMNATTASDVDLSTQNTSVCVIGKGQDFKELSQPELQEYIGKLKSKEEARASADVPMEDAPPAGGDGAAPMDTS